MDAGALFVQLADENVPGRQQPKRGGTQQVCDYTKLPEIMAYVQSEYADFMFTVYRCACKVVTLQKLFYTAKIPFKLVLAMLERHNIREGDVNLMVPPFQLTSLIHDIYFACETLGHFTQSVTYRLETATAVLASFFWDIFDPHRHHSISLLEIKVTLLLLCKLHATDQLVVEFYKLLYEPKLGCVSKRNFEYLLGILTRILTFIGEGKGYGAHNTPVVKEQCFGKGHNVTGFSEYQFHALWTTTQTRFLIYANLIALIKRIEDTEKLIHSNVCASCGVEKIIGIRFKCQQCRNMSLCLRCFATGYTSGRHNPGHRMFEVFTEDAPPKTISHFFAKICNLFVHSKNSSEERKGFCNAGEAAAGNETELESIETNISLHATAGTATTATGSASKIETSLAGLSTTASTASNISERLQLIINRLTQQNAKLEDQLKTVKTASNEEISNFLCAHHKFLIDIINEMRRFSVIRFTESSLNICDYTDFYDFLQKISQSLSLYPASFSTPNHSTCSNTIATIPGDGLINGSTLSHSINGADINRSYLEANKSDFSVRDVSTWFSRRTMTAPLQLSPSSLNALPEVVLLGHVEVGDDINLVDVRDTEMVNFKILLNKVKEIVEDSYSDNTELAAATQNLENVLDSIVNTEVQRRLSS